MIFHRLKLRNFGVYAGEHEIELAPKKKGSPVILFGGLNGRGKTTLLDAIQLLFFGKLNKCSNRGKTAYDKFLLDSMTRSVEPSEGSSLELEFKESNASNEPSFWIKRSWAKTNGKLNENFEVWKGGEKDSFLSNHWLENVDRFLPFGLAELFFFDGEKIESLAEENTAKVILESAIKTLFGVDLIAQLETDLDDLEKRLRKGNSAPAKSDELEKLRKELVLAEEKQSNLTIRSGEIQIKLDKAEIDCREADEKYRLQGGKMAEQRQSVERQLSEIQKRRDLLLDEIRTISSQAGPLMIVEKDIAGLRDQALLEQKVETQNMLLKELGERDKKIIKSLKKAEIDEGARLILETLFDSDIEQRKKATTEQVYLDLEKSDLEKIESYTSKFFEEIRKNVSKLMTDLEKTRDEIKEVEESLLATPEEKSVEGLRSALVDAESNFLRLKAEMATIEEEKPRTERATEELSNKITKLVDAAFDKRITEEETKRKISYAQKTKASLEKYREKIIASKIGKVESLILKSFQRLLQKEKLVRKISIAETDFSIALFDDKGEKIKISRMSAGERQLLAVSILWGLAQASNRNIPNIIDTPLGRLDGSHRDNIVRNYFTKASDQVIILSTDEEIDEKLHAVLGKSVSRQYELVYSDESQSTHVRKGYLFN